MLWPVLTFCTVSGEENAVNLLSFLQGVHSGDNETQISSSTVRLFFQQHGIPVPRVCRGTEQRNSQALMEMCQTIDFSHYRCISTINLSIEWQDFRCYEKVLVF